MTSRLRLYFLSTALLIPWYANPVRSQDADDNSGEVAIEKAADADWNAIRQAAEKYAQAYNAGDADAISGLYSENAELIDVSGTTYRGREQIAGAYRSFFETHPDAEIRIAVESLTFVSATVAIENGTTASRLEKGQAESSSRYTAVHLKQDGQWQMASVRDQSAMTPNQDNLEQLSWLIGRWVDEDPESLMEIDCYWHESGSYLMRDFRIKIKGLLASSGTEIIGWDQQRQQIRSWLFDSEGGYLEASWVRDNDRWVVTAQGFRADGQPTQATYVVTSLRDDAYHMSATHRATGGKQLAAFDMTIVRRPPEPGEVPGVSNADPVDSESQN